MPPSLQVNYLPSEPPEKPRYRIGTLEYPMLNRKKLKGEEILPIGDHQKKINIIVITKKKRRGQTAYLKKLQKTLQTWREIWAFKS